MKSMTAEQATGHQATTGSSQGHSLAQWQHAHEFSSQNRDGEKNTRYVLYLTVITMVAEIAAGTIYGSMALLADGWHMGTHAAAFMITLFAYSYARKHANDPAFAFGTGKVSVLGGYTSAIALGLVALVMLIESGMRLINPEQIHFNEAIFVAVIGLSVNVLSVFLLKDHHTHDHGHTHGHSHDHGHQDDHEDEHAHHSCEAHSSHDDHVHTAHSHGAGPHTHDDSHAHDDSHQDHSHHKHEHHAAEHEHEHEHEHESQKAHGGHDHNLRAAYFHVLADALTSVLAIAALLFGKYMGLTWLDPVMGIVGAVIISRWSWGLIQQTSPILLDGGVKASLQRKVVETLEAVPDHQVADLHLWRVSADHHAIMVSIVSHSPKDVSYFNQLLSQFPELAHITIELHTCRQRECMVKEA
ncbi:CDF family Co(II)/Ni(II) efflux transporter DmeF [Shewanella sp. NKUCC06_TVS]|uniref:CDF family Co(II)/Ni(II) efflux transporter DmeF n=1 Tax=Shewanella sp. NKUCC06_TVS TaxID=2842128 RepID=UPI001C5BA5AA|nr:CDF family Co(II)/Ni(II) efflux transporter DmeF [Shewanella sp. NKUCC06_TVS]MBW3530796.1 CDF family Co(II)/Ni(II) efflux transporter DmeF [Shewanella sp. NKUCC06_TVS]